MASSAASGKTSSPETHVIYNLDNKAYARHTQKECRRQTIQHNAGRYSLPNKRKI